MSMDENQPMSNVRQHGSRSLESAEDVAAREARRSLIKAGAILLPAVLTLRATPAWAQTDYTVTAYRYGTNQGLCRNPHFNPNASPDSTAGQEFIPCKKGIRSNNTPEAETPQSGNDPLHFDR